MITFVNHGDFKRTDSYFEKLLEIVKLGELDKYGKAGVEALAAATPKDTGLTAESWHYRIEREHGGNARVVWYNTNYNKGVLIAVLIQYGHGVNGGGYVAGVDYINPAIKPIFDQISDSVWKEVKKA